MSVSRNLIIMTALLALLLGCGRLAADVTDERIEQFELKGTLGKVMKFLGGGDPTHRTTYYKGDVSRTDYFNEKGELKNSEIIDLERELFITLRHDKEEYRQKTFAEWREEIQEAMERWQGDEQADKSDSEREGEVNYTLSLDVNRTGNTEEVARRQAEEVILTITAVADSTDAEAAKEAPGQMQIISTNWMSPELEGSAEILAFQQKLLEKLLVDPEAGGLAQMWQKLYESYPQAQNALDSLKTLTEEMQGVPVKTFTVLQMTGNDAAEQEEEEEKSGGGLFGKLSNKLTGQDKKKDSGPQEILQMRSEVVRHDTMQVDPALMRVPDNYEFKD